MSALLSPVGAAAALGCVLAFAAFVLGVRSERRETTFWKKRAEYWFARALPAERKSASPDFHLHPLYHATRRYASLDEFLASLAGSRRGEP